MLCPLRPLFLYCQLIRKGLQSLNLNFDRVFIYSKSSLSGQCEIILYLQTHMIRILSTFQGMGHKSWDSNCPRDLSRLQLVIEWVPDSAGFLINSYSLSVILGDLGDLIRCAPIIKVVNMDYPSSCPVRSGDLELFMRIWDLDLGVLR